MRYITIVLFILTLTGCDLNFGEDYEVDASSFTSDHIKTVEHVSRLTLPPDAVGLNMFYQGSGIDDALIAKFHIPQGRVEVLSLAIAAVSGTDAGTSVSLTDGYAWWNEDQLKIKVQRELQVDSDFLELILGEDDGEWFLLVKWFTT